MRSNTPLLGSVGLFIRPGSAPADDPDAGLVDERQFYHQLVLDPTSRTQHYSPFLLNVLLGIGCRFLDPAEVFPREVCSDPNDSSTRGDAFIDFARYNLEREWNFREQMGLR